MWGGRIFEKNDNSRKFAHPLIEEPLKFIAHGYIFKRLQYIANMSEEKVICYQLELGNNLPTFRLNAPVVIRLKVKEVQTNAAIILAMHYWGTCDWRSKVGEDFSSLPASSSQQSSNQGLPVLHLGWSAPLRMSSGCGGRASFINSSCPLPWSSMHCGFLPVDQMVVLPRMLHMSTLSEESARA